MARCGGGQPGRAPPRREAALAGKATGAPCQRSRRRSPASEGGKSSGRAWGTARWKYARSRPIGERRCLQPSPKRSEPAARARVRALAGSALKARRALLPPPSLRRHRDTAQPRCRDPATGVGTTNLRRRTRWRHHLLFVPATPPVLATRIRNLSRPTPPTHRTPTLPANVAISKPLGAESTRAVVRRTDFSDELANRSLGGRSLSAGRSPSSTG